MRAVHFSTSFTKSVFLNMLWHDQPLIFLCFFFFSQVKPRGHTRWPPVFTGRLRSLLTVPGYEAEKLIFKLKSWGGESPRTSAWRLPRCCCCCWKLQCEKKNTRPPRPRDPSQHDPPWTPPRVDFTLHPARLLLQRLGDLWTWERWRHLPTGTSHAASRVKWRRHFLCCSILQTQQTFHFPWNWFISKLW